ncbi:MAG: SWIM zinc finger family protein [Tuberibacillus sp.]
MANISTFVKDKDLRAWLKKFFSRVDAKRRSRGEDLYLDGRVDNLKQKAFGFTAEVNGSNVYQVNAFFNEMSSEELPNIDKSFFTCSCPDSATYCKHMVAAVIKWTVHNDRMKSLAERHAEMKRTQLHIAKRPALERLKRLAKQEQPVKYEEHNGVYWPFKPTLPEVMLRIQSITKEKMGVSPPSH